MRVCVHLLDGATQERSGDFSRISWWAHPKDIVDRVYASIARMTADDEGIHISPPRFESMLPRLSTDIIAKFQETVKALEDSRYPENVQSAYSYHNKIDGTDIWTDFEKYFKKYAISNLGLIPNVTNRFYLEQLEKGLKPKRFDFASVARRIDLYEFIDNCEKRDIPAIFDFLLSLEKGDPSPSSSLFSTIYLTPSLEVIGGVKAIELALDETLNDPELKESTKLTFQMIEYSKLEKVLRKLVKYRELRHQARKILNKLAIQERPPHLFLDELFGVLYSNLFKREVYWRLSGLDELASCLEACIQMYAPNSYKKPEGTKLEIVHPELSKEHLEYSPLEVYFSVRLTDDEMSEAGYGDLSSLLGPSRDMFDIPRSIRIKRIYPAMIREYFELKNEGHDGFPDEKTYFSIKDWKVGLG